MLYDTLIRNALIIDGSDRPGYPADLAILDVMLPGMDGYTLCRRIKDTPALRNIPVTFVSSNDTIEERVTGYDAGGEDFIVKPFEPEELLRKLLVAQNMIAGQRSLAVQAEEAELLSSLVMANMDETGILLQFMSKLIAMESDDEIATGLHLRRDQLVCHHCDNPRCVNPDHLFVGTPRDNWNDMHRKGRASPPPLIRGSAHPKAKLNEGLIPEVFRLRSLGLTTYQIADVFGIGRTSVCAVLNRKTWRHVHATHRHA